MSPSDLTTNQIIWLAHPYGDSIRNGRVVYLTDGEIVVDTLQGGRCKVEVWDSEMVYPTEQEAKAARAFTLLQRGRDMMEEAGRLLAPARTEP